MAWGGDILYFILFLCSTSGPLLPLPHPELNLLNYFKKCTACSLRHRKLHLMVYCIRISIFREKSTDTISDFLFPILLLFASFCIAWFGRSRSRCHQLDDGFKANESYVQSLPAPPDIVYSSRAGLVLHSSSHLVFVMLCTAFKGTSEIGSSDSACAKICHI